MFLILATSCRNKTCIVTFDTDGGTPVSTITINKNESISSVNAPTKEGYTFVGWTLNGNDYAINSNVTENIILKAKWSINSYTIIFDSNGGSSVTSITKKYGDSVTAPNAPTRTGHTFAGWMHNDEPYTFSTMPSSNVSLVAKWEVASYTITFDSNGGSSVTSITKNYGESVTAPNAPTRTGHTFAGWMHNDEPYTFSTMPSSNVSLVAKWEVASYTITFDSNGGSSVTSITKKYGESVTAPNAPTRNEATFVSWTLNNVDYTFDTMPASNIKLVAKWNVNKYTISFDSNGGSEVTSITDEYGKQVKAPTAPTKEDHAFLGWYLNNQPYTFTTISNQNIELVAKWELSYTEYKITYDLNGGLWPRIVDYDTRKEMVDDFIKDYNAFFNSSVVSGGFFDSSYNNGPLETFFNSSTYKAKWTWLKTYVVNTCKNNGYTMITYLTNESDPYHNQYLRSNVHAFINASIQSSWPVSFDFSESAFANGYYEFLPGTDMDVIKTYTVNTPTFALQIPSKTPFTFDGWYNGETKVTEIRGGSRGDITLTAHWVAINYNINYVLNGGSATGLTTTYSSALEEKLKLPAPTRTGYQFQGYYKTADFSGSEFLGIIPGSTGDLTLYVKWAEEKLGANIKISIYGDSISTFENYVPRDALFYYPIYSETVKSAEKTWWKLLCNNLGLKLHTNVSYSGSTVLGSTAACGENDARIAKLAEDGVAPDIIIIYLGINDCVNSATLANFKTGYQSMINKMKVAYPDADIFLCTLGYETYTDGTLRIAFTSAIREIASTNNLPIIDIASVITEATETPTKVNLGDNIHPSATGMINIAKKAEEVLLAYYK